MHQNLYRIDDVLLRAGSFTLLVILAGVFCMLTVGTAQEGPVGLSGYEPVLAVAVLCPIALYWTGFRMRSRERRTTALWKLLQAHAEIRVPELLANSDFDRRDLEEAIRFLNNRGLGHYVWNHKADTVHDARLSTLQLHVEECEVCGAAVSLMVPLNFREVPSCPYCQDPVSVELLEQRRREALDSLRAEGRPQPAIEAPRPAVEAFRPLSRVTSPRSQVPFSIPVFLVLMLIFWPAGVGYAWYRWQRAR